MAGEPFFLFLHYWDVHYDYAPPSPYDAMFDPDYSGDVAAANFIHNDEIHRDMDPRDLEHVVALYDGEVAYTDSFLGKLFAELERLEIWDNTLIVSHLGPWRRVLRARQQGTPQHALRRVVERASDRQAPTAAPGRAEIQRPGGNRRYRPHHARCCRAATSGRGQWGESPDAGE